MIQVGRRQQTALIVLALILVFTAGYRVARWQSPLYGRGPENGQAIVSDEGVGDREIVIHISGAVEIPGLYSFTRGARVSDALARAVPAAGADVQSMNQAALLKDGMKIIVPVKQEVPAGSTAGVAGEAMPVWTPSGPAKININLASAGDLDELPGIGPALAGRIVEYRNQNGLFGQAEELMNVPGIGEKKYSQLKDSITVN